MGRHITLNEEIVWTFPRDGGDDTALGLFQIQEKLGVGYHAMIAYDQERALNEGVYEWKEVDPSKEPFDAELYKVSKEEIAVLRKYVGENTPKVGFLKKLMGKEEAPSDFVSMLSALVNSAGNRDVAEFFSEP